MNDKRNDNLDPKMNRPKQLRIHNVPTDDVKNTNDTN